MVPTVSLLGIEIASVTMAETLTLIEQLVRIGREDDRTSQVATVNVDFLVNALEDPALASILSGADLCLADGMPIVWGLAGLGTPIPERVAGSDLVPLLFERSAESDLRIHVLGSATHVAERAERLVAERYPGARVTFDPGPRIEDPRDIAESLIESIRAVDADILCVALGNPKQERFIAAHRERLGVPVQIGIGGSIDMLVGERVRAPKWMQRTGLEWVARAIQEPGRLGRRYAHDIRVFVPSYGREWWRARRRRSRDQLSNR